jgi:MtN3 and saliva related transmembrane protein
MDSILIQFLGLVAAALTSISMIPQAVKSIYEKQLNDLSITTYLLLFFGVILWIIYGVIQNDLPIILANGIALFPTGIILILKIKEKLKK